MKYYFLLIFILLFSKCVTETVDSKVDLEEKMKKEKKAQERMKEYFRSLDLANKKALTREELINIFHNIFEIGTNEELIDSADKEKQLEKTEKIANQIYNILYTKDKDVIELDKIMEYFNLKTIKNYMNTFFAALGLDKFISIYGQPILHFIEEIYNNYYRSPEL